MRLFYAVELPPEVRAQAATHIAHVRQAIPNARAAWAQEDKLHITLKFLGEIAEERVAALSTAATRAAQSASPFDLLIENTGSFPPRGAARVLWLGVRDVSGGLAALQRLLEDECADEGFAREPRPFKPHLTIARLRMAQDARLLAAMHGETKFRSAEFTVRRLVLMRSRLGTGGASYTTLSTHPLHEGRL